MSAITYKELTKFLRGLWDQSYSERITDIGSLRSDGIYSRLANEPRQVTGDTLY